MESFGVLIAFIVVAILLILIQISIVRWIFRINKQVYLGQKQLDILVEMARRSGVTDDAIRQVLSRPVN